MNSYTCLLFAHDNEKDSKEVSVIAGVKMLPSDFDIMKHCPLHNLYSRQKFPDTLGPQEVVKAQTCSFAEEDEGEFVQVINCFSDHWACVTNKNCKQNEVKVYDSMRTGDI